jgi:hypothetical protein
MTKSRSPGGPRPGQQVLRPRRRSAYACLRLLAGLAYYARSRTVGVSPGSRKMLNGNPVVVIDVRLSSRTVASNGTASASRAVSETQPSVSFSLASSHIHR